MRTFLTQGMEDPYLPDFQESVFVLRFASCDLLTPAFFGNFLPNAMGRKWFPYGCRNELRTGQFFALECPFV